jgi:hypothetical protein
VWGKRGNFSTLAWNSHPYGVEFSTLTNSDRGPFTPTVGGSTLSEKPSRNPRLWTPLILTEAFVFTYCVGYMSYTRCRFVSGKLHLPHTEVRNYHSFLSHQINSGQWCDNAAWLRENDSVKVLRNQINCPWLWQYQTLLAAPLKQSGATAKIWQVYPFMWTILCIFQVPTLIHNHK